MSEMMDVSGSLRKIADELVELAIDIDEAQGLRPEFTEKFGGASFMLRWIANGLDKELAKGKERADAIKKTAAKAAPEKRCSCGDYSLYSSGRCGPNGCYNVPA